MASAVPMVFLSALLVFLAILFSWDVEERTKEYMGLMLVLQVGVLGVFMALDYFLFYIFWEVVLIPMYFLISDMGRSQAGLRGHQVLHLHPRRVAGHAAGDIRACTSAAPLLPAPSFGMIGIALGGRNFGHGFQIAIYAALFFGFGVKMPMVPFHTWLPDAHVEAPTAGSVLLAGLLLKMGGYGIIRVAYTTFPEGRPWRQVLLAVIGHRVDIYGAFACLAQKDLKKMVAYLVDQPHGHRAPGVRHHDRRWGSPRRCSRCSPMA